MTSATPSADTGSAKPSWHLQAIAFLIFVGFPGFWTMAMPVSWVTLQRQGTNISASARTCFFFVIPYRAGEVSGVTDIDTRIPVRKSSSSSSQDSAQRYLQIIGTGGQTIEVPIARSEQRQEQMRSFIQDPNATELKLFLVSDWALAVFGGGFLSLLTGLYLFNAADLAYRAFRRRGGPADSSGIAIVPLRP